MPKRHKAVKIRIIDVGVKYPSEWRKTLIMFAYAGCSLLLSSLSSSVIFWLKKWMPAEPVACPTVSFFSMYVRQASWASAVSKVTSFLLVALWLLQWFLLRYRSIIGRRFLFIIGTLYLYRSLILYVMVLPILALDITYEGKFDGDWKLFLTQTLKITSTDGLLQSPSIFCGVYIYGHATNLILTYLFIKAYSPQKFWAYHALCWSLCVLGLVSGIFLHPYNLVDVIVSYFMTARLFWWYHALANQQWQNKASPENYLSKVWWFRIFVFLENNVLGTIPYSYSWPISCSVCQLRKQKPKPSLYNV